MTKDTIIAALRNASEADRQAIYKEIYAAPPAEDLFQTQLAAFNESCRKAFEGEMTEKDLDTVASNIVNSLI